MKPTGRIFIIEWKRKRFLKSVNTIPIIQRILRETISLSCVSPSVIIDNPMYYLRRFALLRFNFVECFAFLRIRREKKLFS